MDPVGALYTLSALPLLASAVRCWARWARGGRAGWAALGVVLAAFGVDGLRILLRRAEMAPVPWAAPAVLALCGGFLLFVVLRSWRELARPRRVRRPPGQNESSLGPV